MKNPHQVQVSKFNPIQASQPLSSQLKGGILEASEPASGGGSMETDYPNWAVVPKQSMVKWQGYLAEFRRGGTMARFRGEGFVAEFNGGR